MSVAGSQHRAVVMDSAGGPEVLEVRRVEAPTLAPGEVWLETIAAAVNRADLEIRSGTWAIERPDGGAPFPYTPGLEVLGEVIEVGPGVSGVATGDRVITMMQKLGGIHGVRPGGYAERVRVRVETLAPVGDDLDPFAVAALGLAAVTALSALDRLRLEPGQRLVVTGASGGVGSAAIRLARALGAEVVATSSSRGKDDYLLGLGAAEVAHLGEATLLEALGARSVDAVLDPLGGAGFAGRVATLRRGGRLCLVGALTGEDLGLCAWDLLQDLVLTGYSSENLDGLGLRSAMARIQEWLRQGRIEPPAFERFALEEAAAVHRRMEARELAGRALLAP